VRDKVNDKVNLSYPTVQRIVIWLWFRFLWLFPTRFLGAWFTDWLLAGPFFCGGSMQVRGGSELCNSAVATDEL